MNKLVINFNVVLFLLLSVFILSTNCKINKSDSPEFVQGVWLWGSVLNSEDIETVIDKLIDHNISEVYFLVKGTAGVKTNAENLTKFITKAHAKNIEVHLWYIAFEDGEYVAANPQAHIYHCPNPSKNIRRPYPIEDQRVNPLYPGYKEYVYESIRYFLTNFDCDGIHLDVIRYGHFVYSFDPYSLQQAASLGCDTTRLLGFFNTEDNYTTYAKNEGFVDLYANGDQDVVIWIEMRKNIVSDYIKGIRNIINETKPGIELTAAFMPEGAIDTIFSDVFYAQNYRLHSTLLDMISPMVYFKSYDETTEWLKTVTQGIKEQVVPTCKVLTGIQAFNDVTAPQIKEQIQYSFDGGADGIILFRYGTMTEDYWDMVKK